MVAFRRTGDNPSIILTNYDPIYWRIYKSSSRHNVIVMYLNTNRQ